MALSEKESNSQLEFSLLQDQLLHALQKELKRQKQNNPNRKIGSVSIPIREGIFFDSLGTWSIPTTSLRGNSLTDVIEGYALEFDTEYQNLVFENYGNSINPESSAQKYLKEHTSRLLRELIRYMKLAIEKLALLSLPENPGGMEEQNR